MFGRDLKETGHEEDVGLGGRIILQWIFSERDAGAWIVLIRLNIRQVAGTCGCGNEQSGSLIVGNFLSN